jgi:hypothetical protein
VAKHARGRCHSGRAAVRADRGRLEQSDALDRERARPDRLVAPARDRFRLSGQIRFIQREPVRRHHQPVCDHLIASLQAHEIADHHPFDRHAAVDPLAHDHSLRCNQ